MLLAPIASGWFCFAGAVPGGFQRFKTESSDVKNWSCGGRAMPAGAAGFLRQNPIFQKALGFLGAFAVRGAWRLQSLTCRE